ncbi:50S ribosomal protein L1 [Candidatus Peregrinibacteria bacterium]|mgnify:CR=1 FL=1|jgi:large subunit ribosomal protein L1|nr:50S ribosomal protein L1 [Candidatus Peregrinibacteria bacterium]MBT7483490.1 50S ribosomal protein L1 [Candidatus Peregrinibacteria bacterium]MBT7702797.1 50S ribosomal protein L1 [Candidatus Peregrinibacteria bacterium]
MPKRGKKYRALLEKVDPRKVYSVEEASKILKELSPTKFDSTVEIHMNLKVDPTQADQVIRSTVGLPHGTGKEVRVVAFVEDANVKEALDAGAVKAGITELTTEIEKGWLDFDVAVAHPDVMKSLGKIARTLGQKGLMPNPKAGTVTPNIAEAIAETKKGKVEFRNDKQGNLHNAIGKVSFTEEQLKDNIETYLKAIIANRPPGVKGTFIRSVTATTTMGPGIKIDIGAYL